MPSAIPKPSICKRTESSGHHDSSGNRLPPHLKAPNTMNNQGGNDHSIYGNRGDWAQPHAKPVVHAGPPGRKKFTFNTTASGDQFVREKEVPPSDCGITPYDSSHPYRGQAARPVLNHAPPRRATLPPFLVNRAGSATNSSDSRSFNSNTTTPRPIQNNKNAFRPHISIPESVQEQSGAETFENSSEVIQELKRILLNPRCEVEINVQHTKQEHPTHTIRYLSIERGIQVSDTHSAVSEQHDGMNAFDNGVNPVTEPGETIAFVVEGSQTASPQQSGPGDGEGDNQGAKIYVPLASRSFSMPEFLLEERDRSSDDLRSNSPQRMLFHSGQIPDYILDELDRKHDLDEDGEEEELDIVPLDYLDRPTAQPFVKPEPVEHEDEVGEYDVFGRKRPSHKAKLPPVCDTTESQTEIKAEGTVVHPVDPPAEPKPGAKDTPVQPTENPVGSIPAHPTVESTGFTAAQPTENPVGSIPAHPTVESTGFTAAQLTEKLAGFMLTWPKQQPRQKRYEPRSPGKKGKQPFDRLPKNRDGHQQRRAATTPAYRLPALSPGPAPTNSTTPPAFAPALVPAPNEMPVGDLNPASVAVHVSRLPPGTTKKLLISEIRGGSIHSIVIFSTKRPFPDGAARTVEKQAVVYFIDPHSADNFVASQNLVKVLGYQPLISRTVPPDMLAQQLRGFPNGVSRCLRITNLPENKYPAVYISRWVDNVIHGTVLQSVEFDHQNGTAVLQFLGVEEAINTRSKFINAKSCDMEWKAIRVEYAQDPTSILR